MKKLLIAALVLLASTTIASAHWRGYRFRGDWDDYRPYNYGYVAPYRYYAPAYPYYGYSDPYGYYGYYRYGPSWGVHVQVGPWGW